MSGDLAGRVVLVTGGVRGLGAAICAAFAARGAHVVANYFHSRDEAKESGFELVRASVASRDQVDAMFAEIASRHGRLDVLVNNAASGALLPLSEVDDTHWQRAFDTNLRGSLWCATRAAELMPAGGAIVNVSSVGSDLVLDDYATVGTTKAAVEALTRYLAVEFAGRGIRVNTASGGLLDNRIAGMFPDGFAERMSAATPLGRRLGTEAELAELVVFLAGPSASWITGQTVVADGGFSLGATALPPPAADEPGDAIAVVGMGVVTPGATDPDELWRLLCGEDNVFTEPDRFDISSFVGADTDEDRSYTPRSGFITGGPEGERGTHWLRHSVSTALAGVARADGDRWFAAFGATADGSQELEEYLVYAGFRNRLDESAEPALAARYRRGREEPAEYLPHRIGRNALAGLLPERTELVMIDTACSSALYAVDLGAKALREGACDVAVCGAYFAYSARNLVLFSKLSGLSRCGEVRSFDADANGVLFSDGAGAVVLKRLDRARADGDTVLGVLDGTGLSCDGAGKAIYAPQAAGQERALRRAGGGHGADWVICHATGTRAGDSTEVTALRATLGDDRPVLLSSNKAIVGHTGWSAGVVSIVQALTGLRRGTVPPQRFLRTPITALRGSGLRPPTEATPAKLDRVGISSFGFGGTNAHLVISRRPGGAEPELDGGDIVVTGWATHLPGMDDDGAWLRGVGPAPRPEFGDDYPIPDFAEVRLPPATLRTMDRGQIMILRAAAKLDPPLRAALDELADTTGVLVGHAGPTRRAIQYALRCYLADAKHCGVKDYDRLVREVRALVPPSNEDAFPGIMPNLIAARLAAVADWHGLNATIDTGPDAGLDAVRCAERYLRHRDLDAVVVAGISGNSTPELAEVLGESAIAEGAFLVVLTRQAVAEEKGLPVLARLRTEVGETEAGSRPRERMPLAGLGRTYLGADPVVGLLAMVAAGQAGRIGSAGDWGPQLVVGGALNGPRRREEDGSRSAGAERSEAISQSGPPASGLASTEAPARNKPGGSARRREDTGPRPANAERSGTVSSGGAMSAGMSRMVRELVPAPPRLGCPLPAGETVFVDEETELPDGEYRHVRVVARVGAGAADPADLSAMRRLRGLHDKVYVAAQRWARTGGSFGVLMLDSVRDGVVHPATGPFTGLVKSLARDGRAYAVLTDETDLDAGLALLAAEAERVQDLAVSVHHAGQRMAYSLRPAAIHGDRPPASDLAAVRGDPLMPGSAAVRGDRSPTPGPAAVRGDSLAPGSVVVAAGGARGLTVELLAALPQATIYLLGRHAPGGPICGDKAHFIREHPEWTVAQAVAEYETLLARAATSETVERLGAHHIVCDITDADAVMSAVDQIHATHGRVDLLINSAGLHNGGTNVPLAAARAVRDTKLLGYLNLRAAFAGRPPTRWVNIGSLLSVLGWPGEADYCAANDLLNVAASWQHAFGANTVETTLALPLWSEAGFAAEPLVRELLCGRSTLTSVSTVDGVVMFLAELAESAPEVTYLGPAEARVEVPWQLDPEEDAYLAGHRIRGVRTVPAAMLAELALRQVGGTVVTDMELRSPVAFPQTACRAVVEGPTIRVLSDVIAPDGTVLRRDRLHASMTVHSEVCTGTPDFRREPAGEVPDFVTLDGPFRSLRDNRFEPELGTWAARFARFTVPVLLIDAAIQVAAEGIPVRIGRVEVRTRHNDVALLAEHSDRIRVWPTGPGGAVAVVGDDVLVRVSGVESVRRRPGGSDDGDPSGIVRSGARTGAATVS